MELKNMEYKGFLIVPQGYYTEGGVLYDITYSVYKDNEFFNNYLSHTYYQVCRDLDNYI